MRLITDAERRTRLARRHALAPTARTADPVAATRAMTVLHATEAATVHLSLQARVHDLTLADVDRALYEDRSLVKQLAMRRTLWVFPRELLPSAWGSAAARVADQQEQLIARDVERHGVADDGPAWVSRAVAAVLARLADGSEAPAGQLREELPELAGRARQVPGKKYATDTPFGPRVLTLLGARGQLVRGHNGGRWRTSRPRWTRTETWLGEQPAPVAAAEGYAELVRRWLRTFGPGTEADIVWWFGATKGAVRRALADVGALAVDLEGGGTGYVLPDDLEPEEAVEPWVALLPVLDPTVMGWRERDWYLDPDHTPYLFDSFGNAGTTAWVDGRVVGAWVQDEDARVRVLLREDVPPGRRVLLDAEAERLTAFLGGDVVRSIYRSRLMSGEGLS